LFDILTLGAACFDEGLQDILESGDILKVGHQVLYAHHFHGIVIGNIVVCS